MKNVRNNMDTFVDADNPRTKSALAQRFRGFLPVILDIETAGFNANTDAILQVGAVLISMDSHGFLQPCKSLFYEIKPFEGGEGVEGVAFDVSALCGAHQKTVIKIGIVPNQDGSGAVL